MKILNQAWKLLKRQPLAFLGGLGLLSVADGVININGSVLMLVQAYQAVTHPLWDLVVGVPARLVGLTVPDILKDYWTLGLISVGAEAHAYRRALGEIGLKQHGNFPTIQIIDGILFTLAYWPLVWLRTMRLVLKTDHEVTLAFSRKYPGALPPTEDPEILVNFGPAEKAGGREFFNFLFWTMVLVCFIYGQAAWLGWTV